MSDGNPTFENQTGDGNEVPPTEGAEEELLEEVAKGIDPAIYLLIAVVIVAALYYLFFVRNREKEDDDFFSSLDGDKVS